MATNGNDKSKVDPQWHRAIVALLSSRSVAEAATVAGVGERTLFRWLEEPAFKTQLAVAEGELIDAATRRLVQMQGLAVDTLGEMLTNPLAKPSTKLRAATAILDYMLKLREMRSIEERLAALEEALAQQSKQKT